MTPKNNERILCDYCPDTDAYWNRLLEDWRCPDCGGCHTHSEEE